MYTRAALLDVHERTQRSLTGFLDHLATLPPEDPGRTIEAFGEGSIAERVAHVIGAERYWVGVLRGEILVDEDPADAATVDALRAFRDRVAAATIAWLEAATEEELNTARPMRTWRGEERLLVPARVILRTQTHAWHHLGQVAVMCRLLGRPAPAGLDFPLD